MRTFNRRAFERMNTFQHILRLFLTTIFLLFLGCDQSEKEPVQLDKTSIKQPQFAGTLIAVGDSLTAGLGVDETEAWPFLLQNRLQEKGYNWQVINAGISGETSSGALTRIKWILAQKPDIVLLETGANDGLRGIPINVIEQNITQAISKLQEQRTTVILAGMQIVQNLGPEYTEGFAGIYPVAAEKTGCILIPFFLQDVAGEQTLNQADTIHPNKKGHAVIADTVLPYVVDAIRQTK